MHEDDKQNFVDLELRPKAKEDLNKKTILQRAGEYLTYGQEVQLKHKSCLMVSLSLDRRSKVCLKIAIRFKFRKEGDKVMYGNNVLFLIIKEVGNYLHVTNKL